MVGSVAILLLAPNASGTCGMVGSPSRVAQQCPGDPYIVFFERAFLAMSISKPRQCGRSIVPSNCKTPISGTRPACR